MFSGQKGHSATKSKRRGASFNETGVTILTPGCHFNGKLYCKGASRIGGRIEGEIVSEGQLIIEEEALVTAQIKADEAIVQGRVRGKLEAKGRVELAETSQFEGDIITPSLVIVEGAKFNGNASMVIPPVATIAPEKFPMVEKLLGKKNNQGTDESGKKIPEVAVIK